MKNLLGFIAFAQPTDRSRPLEAYIVTGQNVERGVTWLELVLARGGLLSSQVQLVPLSNDGWVVAGYQSGNDAIAEIIEEMTSVLQNSSLTLTEETRRETTATRGYLVDALAFRLRNIRKENREAEDAGIAAARAASDRSFEAQYECLSTDPNPNTESEEEGSPVSIAITVKSADPIITERMTGRIAETLKAAGIKVA